MLIRTPNILFVKYGTLASISANASTSTSSTSLNQYRKRTRNQRYPSRGNKSYATIAESNFEQRHRFEHAQYSWPKPPDGHPHPTPYQIFDMTNDASYSKSRYYELVKLYHPDRASIRSDDLPRPVKLERYRLIVAAHTILSDPAKRSAYDRFGAGWNGKAEVGGRQTWHHPEPAGPFSRSWGDPSDPIWQNATWEDWERFYEWRAAKMGGAEGQRRKRRSPLYMSNSYFVFLVAALGLMGSTANQYRAHDAGAYFVEQRDIIHDRAAKDLRKVRQEATQTGSRQDRIDWFLRNRDATLGSPGSDPEALRQEKIDRLLPDREVCNSEEIVEKSE